MWIRDKSVEESRDKNVETTYPHFQSVSCKVVRGIYPRLFFSVYMYLSGLIGFPRPYYYY